MRNGAAAQKRAAASFFAPARAAGYRPHDEPSRLAAKLKDRRPLANGQWRADCHLPNQAARRGMIRERGHPFFRKMMILHKKSNPFFEKSGKMGDFLSASDNRPDTTETIHSDSRLIKHI